LLSNEVFIASPRITPGKDASVDSMLLAQEVSTHLELSELCRLKRLRTSMRQRSYCERLSRFQSVGMLTQVEK
jgi:hypothetical protein